MLPAIPLDLLEFIKISDFGSLERAIRTKLSETAPEPSVKGLIFLAPVAGKPGYRLVAGEALEGDGNDFHVLGESEELGQLLSEPTGIVPLVTGAPDLIEGGAAMVSLGPAHSGQAYLVHSPAGDADDIAIVVYLADGAAAPEHLWRDRIRELAEAANHVADVITAAELLRRELWTTARVRERMLRPLAASDRAQLAGDFADILSRQFGFGRVYVAFIDRGANAYRCELRTGFDASFPPVSVQRDQADNFFVRAVRTGEVLYFDRAGMTVPELAPFAGGNLIRRAILAPLRTDEGEAGFIYADKPKWDDAFVLRHAMESFADLASAAIEAFDRRANAERQAETDALTGCFNRYYLDRILEVEIPRVRRYNSPISLLMIDLCDFKRTNDTYGHVFGDTILRETASILRANVREPDIVVRYGGDEFVVLMVNTGAEQARLVQSRVERAFIERNRAQTDEKMMIDISIGLRSADAESISTLLEDADRSMYAHKNERRKRQIVEALLELPAGRPDAAYQSAIDSVTSSFLANLSKKEPHYAAHAKRTAYLCLFIARQLGMKTPELHSLVLAALLHDVGKASLPTEILQRPGPLTESERKAVRTHPVLGSEFLQGIQHLEEARPMIKHHHERFDGETEGEHGGYPSGLARDAIPLGARILKLADCVDSMLAGRPYRAALPMDAVLQVVREESGGAFDPELAGLLLRDSRWQEGINSGGSLARLYSEMIEENAAAENATPMPAGAE